MPGRGVGDGDRVALPVSALTDQEPREGMLVTLPQSLTIGEYFNFDRFNETVLTVGRQMTSRRPWSSPARRRRRWPRRNLLGRITLDDGRNAQNPDPALHPDGEVFDLANRFRGGDRSRTSPACSTSRSASGGSSRPRAPTTPRRTRVRRGPTTSAAI